MKLDGADIERVWFENYATALHTMTGFHSYIEAERAGVAGLAESDEVAAAAADAMTRRTPGVDSSAWQRFTNDRAQRRRSTRPQEKRGAKAPRSGRRLAATIPRPAPSA